MNAAAANQATASGQPDALPPKKKRRPSGSLECKLGLLLGVLGLIASRLGQLWIAFDVFAQFTLHFALVAVAFLIGLLMPRAKLLAAFLVLVLGVIGIGAWPHLANRSPSAGAAAGSGEIALKVASFNTLYDNEQAEAVQAEILRIDADVITLTEMGPNKRRIIAAVKERYPHQAACYEIDFCNLVVLSKFPVVETDAQALWEGAPYIRAKLGPEAGGLTVFGVHTIRFPHSRAQFRQVNAIADLIEKTPGRKLVMGDFNATPFSRIIAVLENRANLQRLSNLPSWPSHAALPQLAIDHIFISPGLKQIQSQSIGEPAGSDHYPVIARIAVPLAQ